MSETLETGVTPMSQKTISKSVLKRLPSYLTYLRQQPESVVNISATALASALGLGEVQVRKDLAMVSDGGRPKIGYVRTALINDIEEFLGCDNTNDAVLIGCGGLGGALLGYSGFDEYGLNIVAAFDADEKLVGMRKNGKLIRSMSELESYCKSRNVLMGIITVPAAYAQGVSDRLIECGILAIWNFAPIRLEVPEGILVQSENMATSLAILSKHLAVQIDKRNLV